MFKRIILFILIISPFLFVFLIGYPTIKNDSINKSNLQNNKTTTRCFKVGELKQMITCYSHGGRTGGLLLLNDINQKTNLMFGGAINGLFYLLLGGVLIGTIRIVIFENKHLR